jgi:2-hydroxy-6-oxonona-2,4-dienedioate hydrolase
MPSRDLVRPTRREFLSGVSALTVILSPLQGASSDSVTPLVAGPEVDAFKEAQARCSAKFGYRAHSRFIKIAQPPLTLHVLEAGHGNPVVLLSGGSTVVQFAAPLASPLSREFHTFAMDRPGCGLSDRLDYRGTPSREQAVTCIGSLLDTLKLHRVALVGNSMGGFWALAFALARPERVSKLVFLGEVAGSSPPQPPVAALPSTSPASPPSLEGLRARYAARLVAHVERVPPEVLQAVYAAEILPGYAQSTATMMQQIAHEGIPLTYALRPELKNLKPDTLFIWGDQDKLGPAMLGREMASMIPHARCEVVKEAGHLPWLDESELCIRLTRDFLRQS